MCKLSIFVLNPGSEMCVCFFFIVFGLQNHIEQSVFYKHEGDIRKNVNEMNKLAFKIFAMKMRYINDSF